MPDWMVSGDLYSTGVPGRIGMRAGQLLGSQDALYDYHAARQKGQVDLTPTGPFLEVDDSELCAYAVALNLFSGPEVEGEPPVLPIPDLPEGAIP